MAADMNLGLAMPTTEEQTVAPDMARRRPNAELRSREHLTPDEVERLIAAAKQGRWGHCDATMILVADRLTLGSGRLFGGQPSRPARQEGLPCNPSHPGGRAARAPPPAARANP